MSDTRQAAEEVVTGWQLTWAKNPPAGEERDGLVHCIAAALTAARAEGRAEGLREAADLALARQERDDANRRSLAHEAKEERLRVDLDTALEDNQRLRSSLTISNTTGVSLNEEVLRLQTVLKECRKVFAVLSRPLVVEDVLNMQEAAAETLQRIDAALYNGARYE